MGGKTSTSTQQVTIPKQVLQRYNAVNKMAANVAKQPFQQYGTDPSAFVAQMNGQQQQGIDAINNAGNVGAPLFEQAMQYTSQGANANITPGELDVDKYMNPYQRNVVDATAALIDQGNEQAMAGQTGNAIRSGAFGGDRAGIAAATLAGQQSMSRNMTLSDILQKGFTQAQGVAQQQQGLDVATQQANAARALQAGQQFGGLGQAMQALALQGGEAQLNAGGLQQQTEQAGKTALYNQFQQQQGYPFQVAQFLANIAMGTGSLSGSTTTTQQPAPFFSDRRLKHDITEIGKTDHGMPIYRFKYKGDDQYHMGFMAQEVEKRHPDAVGEAGGYKTVDYSKADKFADGGQVAGPYGAAVGSQPGGNGYVPQGYLPVGDLMTADGDLLENDQQSLADLIASSSAFGKNLMSLKDTFGQLTYRGGVVNKATGGGVYAPVPTESYLASTVDQQDEDAKKRSDLKTASNLPPPQESPASQIGSAAGGIGSLLGGIASIIPFLSDRRAKENIKRIGYSHHGQPIYQYNYKGENRPQIGFIAQDVEKDHPDAVHEIGGLKHVDLSMAHKFAAGGTAGGSTATGGLNGGSRDQSAPTPAPSRPSEGSYPSQGGGLGGYIDVSKVVDSGPGWNMLEMENGKIYKNEGSWNVRANNPGNISAGTFSKYSNAVGNDGRFAVYANPDDGKAAMNSLLFETPIDAPGVSLPVDYKNLTLSQAISEYAPPKENNTPRYISLVDKAVDAPSSMVLGQYDPAQRQAMVNAMMEHEGFNNPIKQTYVGQRGRIGIPARTGFALGGVPEEEDPMMEALRRPYTDNGLTNSSGLRPGGVEAVPVNSTAATTAMRMQAPAKDLTPINPDAYRGTPQAERDRADAMTGPALGAPTTAGLAAPVANAVRPSVNFENNQGLAGFRRSDLDGETFVKPKPAVVVPKIQQAAAVEEPVPGLAPAKVVADPPKVAVANDQPSLAYAEVVAAGPGWTEVRLQDGSIVRQKGVRSVRNNNQGNIEYGDFAKSQGAIGTDGRFAVFPTKEAGAKAMESLLFGTKSYSDKTVAQAIARYAPPSENNTSAYISTVSNALGVDPNTPMSQLTPEQRTQMVAAMAAVEGRGAPVTSSPATEGTKSSLSEALSRPVNAVADAASSATDGIKGLLSKATSNPDLLLSLLSGVGAMASSPSRYLGSAILQGLGAGANTYAGLRKQSSDMASVNRDTLKSIAQQAISLSATSGKPVSMQDVADSLGYKGPIPANMTPQDIVGDYKPTTTEDNIKNVDFRAFREPSASTRFGEGVKVLNMDDPEYLRSFIAKYGLVDVPEIQAMVEQAKARRDEIEKSGQTYGEDANRVRVTVPVPEVMAAADTATQAEANRVATASFNDEARTALPSISQSLALVSQQKKLFGELESGAFTTETAKLSAALKAVGLNVSEDLLADPKLVEQAVKLATEQAIQELRSLPGGAPAAELSALSNIVASPDLQPEAVKKIIAIKEAALLRAKDRYEMRSQFGGADQLAYEKWFEQNRPFEGYLSDVMKSMPAFKGEAIPRPESFSPDLWSRMSEEDKRKASELSGAKP